LLPTKAALLPTKGVAKQPAAAAGWTETKPDPKAMSRYPVAWRQAVDDRDYLIRTIAFEASGEPQMAQIAVAHVVLNQKKSGRWGDNIKAVVTHPGQFEPWTTRQREIEELSPDDPRYQSATIIADAVLSGQTPDPTAGATHFLNPTIVRERRGGALPSWAAGEGLTIGSHTFYFFPEESDASPQRTGGRSAFHADAPQGPVRLPNAARGRHADQTSAYRRIGLCKIRPSKELGGADRSRSRLAR
jgi:spore germination cell wall hydrolase CwlJ-like protein